MGTSAGITFKTVTNVDKLEQLLEDLDKITNEGGLGVACTPILWDNGNGTLDISAQTHWSYDGENGRDFLRELHKLLKVNEITLDIIDEWER